MHECTRLYVLYTQVHEVSTKVAGEKARIMLKTLETLSYSCNDSKPLVDLGKKLQLLLQEFQQQLPQEEGLVVRSAVVSRATKTRRKYARIRATQQIAYCSALEEARKGGRKRANSKYRNRFGSKTDRLRKVSCL